LFKIAVVDAQKDTNSWLCLKSPDTTDMQKHSLPTPGFCYPSNWQLPTIACHLRLLDPARDGHLIHGHDFWLFLDPGSGIE